MYSLHTQLDFFGSVVGSLGNAVPSTFYTPYNPVIVFAVGLGVTGGLSCSAPYF